MIFIWPVRQLLHSMVKDQPAVLRQHGWGASAYLQGFPWSDGSSWTEVGIEQGWRLGLQAIFRHRAVGDPDAFVVPVLDATGGGAPRGLRAGAGKKGPVQHRHLRFPGVIRHRDREEAGVFVIHMNKIDPLIGCERCQFKASPMKKVIRSGWRRPRGAIPPPPLRGRAP